MSTEKSFSVQRNDEKLNVGACYDLLLARWTMLIVGMIGMGFWLAPAIGSAQSSVPTSSKKTIQDAGVTLSATPVARGGLEMPRPFSEQPAVISAIGYLSAIPLTLDATLCPSGAACPLGAGGGAGGYAEIRWPSGLSVNGGYDLAFLDGNGVYEISVFQTFRIGVRNYFFSADNVHPYLGVAIGLNLFGDTFAADSYGGSLDLDLGVEIEVNPKIAVAFSTMTRVFALAPFQTDSDNIRRAQDFGLNALTGLKFEIVIWVSEI